MKQGPKQEGATGVPGASPAHGSESGLSHPSDLKPWEDRSLPPEDRLRAYKDFIGEKIAEISAAISRYSPLTHSNSSLHGINSIPFEV